MVKTTYHYGLGRRKSAIARARLLPGKGEITVNGKSALVYFGASQPLLEDLIKPLEEIGKAKQMDVSLKVSGGGLSSQVDAARLAIAKAASLLGGDIRTALKKAGELKRDPREKERKKYGLRSARKKEQFSKR
ncbi:MAG: 30S ribosomal protein S9 [Candidatus Chaera renei]|uniref:Small ribosomal subunit protein uS9 n=1 Tax=Candidatus Chaera renei TaxID=2506947 RepID=A0A4Q0AJM3_9BACT|nr:MAG: 30S ribosomal protein S9 [Candidatus Chaera renei]